MLVVQRLFKFFFSALSASSAVNYSVSGIHATKYPALEIGCRQNCYCNLQHIELMNEQKNRQFGGWGRPQTLICKPFRP